VACWALAKRHCKPQGASSHVKSLWPPLSLTPPTIPCAGTGLSLKLPYLLRAGSAKRHTAAFHLLTEISSTKEDGIHDPEKETEDGTPHRDPRECSRALSVLPAHSAPNNHCPHLPFPLHYKDRCLSFWPLWVIGAHLPAVPHACKKIVHVVLCQPVYSVFFSRLEPSSEGRIKSLLP
jgi:hypothetical protein